MKMVENIKTTTSIVLITETEESERQSSDVEEDNIPLIQTLVTKDIEISGETCVGKKVMKHFAEGLFMSEVMTATKQRGRYLYHVVYEHVIYTMLSQKSLGIFHTCATLLTGILKNLFLLKGWP